MLIIIFLALLVRLPGILAGNFAFTYDTGRDLLAISDLLTTGDIHLIGHTTGIIGVFYGPWWYWVLTIPFFVTRGNPIALTAFIAILASFSAGLAFWWGTRAFNYTFGLIVGLLLALSPDIIKITNQLWNPHLLVPTTLLVVMLLKNIERLTLPKLIILGVLLGLLSEFEIIFGILFILGFLLTRPRKILPVLFGIIIVEIPRILFELRNGFIQTKSFLGSFANSESVWQLHTKRDWLIYESLSTVLPGPPWMQNIFVLIILYLIITSWRKFPKLQKKFIATLLLIIGIFWTAIFVYPRDFWHYYLLGLPVLYAFVVAFVVSRLPIHFVIVYLLFAIQPIKLIQSIAKPQFVGNAAVYHNQIEVVQTLYKETTSDFKYIAYTPPQIDYTWKYLFRWENTKKYQYKLSEDPPIMYVILEPDEAYPERIKEWLRVRAKDGVVVSEKKFPSGIIVQTRRLKWN
ncbi:MAG: hypothetical protein ACD_36C00113G0002 [uncultured bacterium]|nr:MAG: hypothetical protein ACD_36C00113G0002 [uncultured bacterium]